MLLPARLLLALTFLAAGTTKLIDRPGFRQTLAEFGVPRRWLALLHILLPASELMTGLVLLGDKTFWWGGLAALILLVLFTAAVAANLLRGRRPSCHCFGQLSAGNVNRWTLVRNGLLGVLAIFVLWRGPRQAGAGIADVLTAAGALSLGDLLPITIGLVLFAVQGWLILHLMRQNGRLLLRLEALESRLGASDRPLHYSPPTPDLNGLKVGARAPSFRLPALNQPGPISLKTLLAHKKLLMLIFIDPECSSCTQLLPEIVRWQQAHASRLTIAVISRLIRHGNGRNIDKQSLRYLLLQEKHEVAEAFRVRATPSAILLRPDGTIVSVLATGADAIRNLVRQAVQEAILGQQPLRMNDIQL
jgi:peroxiredoxin/uncharacterized membrane protein YphA (DoxX/SURF4 family)